MGNFPMNFMGPSAGKAFAAVQKAWVCLASLSLDLSQSLMSPITLA